VFLGENNERKLKRKKEEEKKQPNIFTVDDQRFNAG